MPKLNLMPLALAFATGFGFGFAYHHIVSMAHNALDGDSDGSTSARLASVEARLAALEAGRPFVPNLTARPTGRPDGGAVVATTSHRHRKRRHKVATPLETPLESRAEAEGDEGPAEEAAVDTSGCPPGRKPYHLVLTAQDSPYQAWQTRIMYHHFKKLQRQNPCTEMTGFTRLLSSADGRLDALADEIPTVTARMLAGGSGCRSTTENSCDMGFPVMNRPHAVTQLLAKLPETLTEEYAPSRTDTKDAQR